MRFLRALLLPALLVALVGCDSGSDVLTEAELAGTWDAEAASLQLAGFASVDVLSALESGDRLSMRFESRGQYAAALELAEPRSLAVPNTSITLTFESGGFEGSYSIADASRLRFTVGGVPGEATVEYTYRASSGGDRLTLILRNTEETRAVLALILGSEELAALVTRGELRLRRAS